MPKPEVPFIESTPDAWSEQRERLMQGRIKDLGLKIEGTYLEPIIAHLYEELEAAGIAFKPKVYLSNEWSCPDGVPVIGIPFYLADARLARIEDEMMDGVEAQSELEILSYLRHEAGHAFNYAHKLYDTADWRELFGDFLLPYLEEFVPQPFSRNFVRHIPGWYAQKHPDEDFAETFAIWLTPDSNWREAYRGWGCYEKLEYVDKIVRERGRGAPIVTGEDYDFTSEDLVYSIAEHYKNTAVEAGPIHADFDHELHYIFRQTHQAAAAHQPAHLFLASHRRLITGKIAYWTGLYDVQVRALINYLVQQVERLQLNMSTEDSERVLVEFVAFSSTLCMNRLYKGDFVFNREVT
jgi:Putative zinc-binding metallo-peptidase